ncbi:MAG: S-layer homology domain-containing protein [Chloroflexota bacterium]
MYRVNASKKSGNKVFAAALLMIAILLSLSETGTTSTAQADTAARSSSNAPDAPSCPGGQCFTDVPPSHSFFDFANRLYQQEIMVGYACGGPGEPCDANNRPYFRPGSNVTRGQMTKFVDNARRLPGIYIDTNSDTLPVFARTTFAGRSAVVGASASGSGLEGSSASGSGVAGISGSGDGVYGYSTNYEGVRGETGSNYAGVYGRNTSTGAVGPGVRGDSATGPGVYGLGDISAGVWGKSVNSYGVRAESVNSIGLYASTTGNGATAIYGTSATGRGVYGTSSSATHPGIEGNNLAGGTGVSGSASGSGSAIYGFNTAQGGYAGYFEGNLHVTGACCEAAAGTFMIDDPLDPEHKYLSHSAVESPEMMDIYSGNVTTDASGSATVSMPAYFEALNRDFRYQLTVVGQFAQAVVMSEINDNSFVIKTDKPSVKVSWQVAGIRHDPYALQNPVAVEQTKSKDSQGKYLYPSAYGQPQSKGIGYEREQNMKQP